MFRVCYEEKEDARGTKRMLFLACVAFVSLLLLATYFKLMARTAARIYAVRWAGIH